MARDTVGGYNGNKGGGKGGGGAYAMQDMFSFIDRPQPILGNGGSPATSPTQWGGRLAALYTVIPEEKVEPVPTPSPEWIRPQGRPAEVKTFESPNTFSALRHEDPEPRGRLQLKEEFSECSCEDPQCVKGSGEPSKRALKGAVENRMSVRDSSKRRKTHRKR